MQGGCVLLLELGKNDVHIETEGVDGRVSIVNRDAFLFTHRQMFKLQDRRRILEKRR